MPATNPEVEAAAQDTRSCGGAIRWRADGGPRRDRRRGHHGKTTTTALLAHTLLHAGLDPTYIVGGVMRNTGTNVGVGQGAPFVIEADEYDRMFSAHPTIAVVTNVEHDHPDCFPTLAEMLPPSRNSRRCSRRMARWSSAPTTNRLALGQRRWRAGGRVTSYGVGPASGDWSAADIEPDAAGGTSFTVRYGGP